MTERAEKPPTSGSSAVGAGAAGAGGGTLVALLASNLPNDSSWKSWLIVLAPALTVGIGAAWTWLSRSLDTMQREREISSNLLEARRTLLESLKNPNNSDARRNEIQQNIEMLESLEFGRRLQKISALTGSQWLAPQDRPGGLGTSGG